MSRSGRGLRHSLAGLTKVARRGTEGKHEPVDSPTGNAESVAAKPITQRLRHWRPVLQGN